VSLRSLPATVLEVAGIAEQGIPGRSLAELWRSSEEPAVFDTVASFVRRVARQPEWFPASQGDLIALHADTLRYLRILPAGREELFVHRRDPAERHDLVRDPLLAPAVAGFRRASEALTGPRNQGAPRP
jgi:hypothetical protein